MSTPERWMRRALALARRGAGWTSPNPMVGCLILRAGCLIGEGFHAYYGGAHAEARALASVSDPELLRGATMVVTLEPCAHWGKTPPCTELIIRSGIRRVLVGALDPLMGGRGVARLREAGLEVETGLLEAECRELNAGFFTWARLGRPWIALKIAQSLDGRVATRTGSSRWVTAVPARRWVHRCRARVDAVLVGTGTVAADDPALTVRHVRGRQPWRVVLDRRGSLPADRRLFTDSLCGRTWVFTAPGVVPSYAEQLLQCGGRIFSVPEGPGGLDLAAVLERLAREGVRTVLVEAGPRLATALIRAGLVDRLYCLIAPKLVGSGLEAIGELGVWEMDQARPLAFHRLRRIGPDLLIEATVDSPGGGGCSPVS
jgi:diaminohydroxyphosphoribosylaminopyrimidine deaminase/5-amino-6-(5-phosphoribosylamino)uracil reductase